MKVYELIMLVSFIVVLIDYYRNRKIGVGVWLFEVSVFSFILKGFTILISLMYGLVILTTKVDWSFLTLKLW